MDDPVMRKHPLAKCEECPIYEIGAFVPTQNLHPSARIAVIGEAPGVQEAAQGIPFMGPSGRLLNQVLNHNNIDREDVMVSNICLCLEHNALVRLSDGTNAKISDLVRSKYDGEVLSEEDGKLVSKRVVGWYKSFIGNKKLLRIVHAAAKNGANGRVGVTLTNDHKVLTKRGWIRADELIRNEDEICTGLPDFYGNAFQLIISARLGDGEFYTRTSYQESHCDEQLEYMILRRNILSGFNPTKIVRYGQRNVYRIKAQRALLNITSMSNIELVEKLDWFGFSLWFMDDGYIRPNKWYSEISVTRLDYDEAVKIAEIISEKFANCYVINTSIGPRLMFGVESTKIISNNIARYIPECLRYKLRPEDRLVEFDSNSWEPGPQSILYATITSITEVLSPYKSVYCIDVEDTHRFVTVGGVVHNCRPENNDDPPKAAIDACKPRLDYEIANSGVKKILAVGGTSAKALLGSSKTITNLRVGGPKPYVEDHSIEVVATWHPAYCVSPDTRVLTSNLQWIPAKDIEIDSELIGFDEYIIPGFYEQRQLRPTRVNNKEFLRLPSYKIVTEKSTVVVSSDHMWLAKKDRSYWTPFEWVSTKNLAKDKYRIGYYIDPWEEVNTYEAGYIAGFIDGEGYVGHSQLAWAQNPGPTADAMLQLVKSFGFDITVSPVVGSNCYRFHFKGKRDSITALGMFRPERLVKNARKLWENKKANNGAVKVLSVEFVGDREVVALSTSEKTFIAEGLLSHNCLRSPDAFPSFVKDSAKLVRYDTPSWNEPQYKEYRDPDTILQVIEKLGQLAGPFVIDIECGVDKDVSYVHPDHYEMLCIGICWQPGKAVVLGKGINDPRVKIALGDLLRKKKLIAHNGKFDLNGLHPLLGPLELWADTMLMSYVLDERPGQHGLKKLSIELLGAPDYEEAIREYVPRGGNYADIPVSILHKYNAFDVVCTWGLYELFNKEMGERERRLHEFLIKISNTLMYLERAGISLDLDYNDELAIQFLAEIDKIEEEIVDATGLKINPRSPQQITKYMSEQGYIFDTTEAAFLIEVLPKLEGDAAKFIELLLKHRKQAKLYGTYVKGFRRREYQGKIFTTYSIHGTTSGRLASRNPNLQNIVKDNRIKHQFTVEDDHNILVHCDYKQAEGRVIATLARDEYLAGIFRNTTRDIFTELTMQVYGSLDVYDARRRIKSVFYGLSYGRGAASIGQELDIPFEEAKELLASFRALIPSTVSWQASITQKVLSGEDLITPFGRRRSFWLITDQNKADVINEALSYLPQSIASDICVSALIALQPKLNGLAKIRLTIHDALIAECREQDKEEVSSIMVAEMVKSGLAFTDYVPFAVDTSFGKRWSNL